MQLHSLKPAAGAVKNKKRVGRGHSSGHGKTSGKGHKGQLARSGGGKGPGFEGGQTPIQRRLPKLPGFKNRFKKEFNIVNLNQLEVKFNNNETVSPTSLKERGLIKKEKLPVKVLANGSLTKKLIVKAHQFSATAQEKIKASGGEVEVLALD